MEPLSRVACMELLLTCVDLFQPENCGCYARFSAEGRFSMALAEKIPAGFPQDYEQMRELSGRIYQDMIRAGLSEQYLANPHFAEMKEQIDTLSFEGCAQFLLFWSRANLRYGQEFFYKTWQEGTVLRVLRRMVSQLGSFRFPEERHQ